jgi:hypothetical protein
MRWFRRQQDEKPIKPPPFLEIRSAKWFILLVVGFAIFTVRSHTPYGGAVVLTGFYRTSSYTA